MVLSFYIKGFNSDHLKNRNKGFLNEPKVGKKKNKKQKKKDFIYLSLCDLFKL